MTVMQADLNDETTVYHAPDIECDGCAASIRNVLARLAGIETVTVDVEAKTVTVTHDPQTVTTETVLTALDKAGFPSTPQPPA